MPCGHGCPYNKRSYGCCKYNKYDGHDKYDKYDKYAQEECDGRKAFAQIVVDIPASNSSNGPPVCDATECVSASLSDYVPLCGFKEPVVVKSIDKLLKDDCRECLAFKVKVAYDDCYYAKSYPPLLQVTTAAADAHNFCAHVKPLLCESNTQHAWFRVSIPKQTEDCYPTCNDDGNHEAGQVTFNILAIGQDCVPHH